MTYPQIVQQSTTHSKLVSHHRALEITESGKRGCLARIGAINIDERVRIILAMIKIERTIQLIQFTDCCTE